MKIYEPAEAMFGFEEIMRNMHKGVTRIAVEIILGSWNLRI